MPLVVQPIVFASTASTSSPSNDGEFVGHEKGEEFVADDGDGDDLHIGLKQTSVDEGDMAESQVRPSNKSPAPLQIKSISLGSGSSSFSSSATGTVTSIATASKGPSAAPTIQPLSSSVINRIAAGEVIHRPSSALKELIENSLDAHSTRISITIGDGGLSSIMIQDNGCGIRVEDFPILCQRFTTSKLRTYDDLKSIASFGFRGEALASISHVARVTVTSRTASSSCAYKAYFLDGALVDSDSFFKIKEQSLSSSNSTDFYNPNSSLLPNITSNSNPSSSMGDLSAIPAAAMPKPCAGSQGTTILIEDLFYNNPIRRQSIKNNSSDEYQKCLDVVSKYSIHYSTKSAFICKRVSKTSNLDLNTQIQGSAKDNIRSVFSPALAKELLPLFLSLSEDECAEKGIQNSFLKIDGQISSPNYNQKKLVLLLFINHRLVESQTLKRLIDDIYSRLLPRHTHPFVYLSIEMAPGIVDVNVHPTKREVHFLYEECVLSAIEEAFNKFLAGANKSRVFQTRSVILPSPSSIVNASPTPPQSSYTDDSPNLPQESIRPSPIPIAISSLRPLPVSLPKESPILTVTLPRPSSRFQESEDDLESPPPLASPAKSSFPATPSLSSNSSPLPTPGSFASHSPSFLRPTPISSPPASSSNTAPRRDNKLVRNDHQQSKLDSFLISSGSKKRPASSLDEEPQAYLSDSAVSRPRVLLSSVQNLVNGIIALSHQGLHQLFKQAIFVGLVNHQYCLVQSETKLYLLQMQNISQHYFYETSLRRFGQVPLHSFTKPLPVYPLVRLALKKQTGSSLGNSELDARATALTQVLNEKKQMLKEYFSIWLESDSRDGSLSIFALPQLLDQYIPALVLLPSFLLGLARDTEWNLEQQCFESVSKSLALFYRFQPESLYTALAPSLVESSLPFNQLIPHVFLPLLKSSTSFNPPARFMFRSSSLLNSSSEFTSGFASSSHSTVNSGDSASVICIATLEGLYKVFERC